MCRPLIPTFCDKLHPRNLGILPLPKRLNKRGTPQEIQQGIAHTFKSGKKQLRSSLSTAALLQRFGAPASPPTMSGEDFSNDSSLCLAALSTFKLLRANLRACRVSIQASVYIATREENILMADVHDGIQSLLNECPVDPPLHLPEHSHIWAPIQTRSLVSEACNCLVTICGPNNIPRTLGSGNGSSLSRRELWKRFKT